MKDTERTEKLFNEYLYLIYEIKEYMNLHNWEIALKWKDKLPGDAALAKCEYKYYTAEINFDHNSMLYDKQINIEAEQICQLFIHEICHIFTWAWTFYIYLRQT